MLILKGVMAAILVSLPVLILSDLHAYSRFEESEFVARKGRQRRLLWAATLRAPMSLLWQASNTL